MTEMSLSERLIFLLLVVSFALGNLYKVSFFSPDVRISPLDISVFLITIVLLIKQSSRLGGIFLENKNILKPLLIFCILAFISLVISIFNFGMTTFLIGGMYLVRFVFLGIFFICLKELFTQKQLHKIMIALVGVILITGLGQYLFSPDVRNLAVSEWDPHYFRVVGTLLDPGFMGELLLLSLIYLITQPLHNHRLNAVFIFLTYITFSLTYSRSSFLAAFGAVFFYSYIKKSWKFLLIGAAILSLTLIVLPRAPGGEGVKLERTSSITARILNWKNSLTIISSNPVLGVGFNTYRYAQKQFGFLDSNLWLKSHAGAGADSSLLFVAATTGIIGLTLYLVYLRSFWVIGHQDITLSLSLLTLLNHSFFLNSLFYPFILVWLSVLTASVFKDYK